ncbi:hypothetical protein QFC19_004973 [Naganishia cerealis]|uniref:Uncharacterized protein n=1 Tax=Naganishia cerealis TaxID=610337 RepID=A0ACC2VT29_9TREE|nr:hypothetical protein QFC19_004973 [Naganishia cerealis]
MAHPRQAGPSRGRGRGRGGGRGGGPRLPSLLSDELGVPRAKKPHEAAPRSNGKRAAPPAGDVQRKRKREGEPDARRATHHRRHNDDDEAEEKEGDDDDEQRGLPPVAKVSIPQGSGFRTKVSSNASTPLARLLAAQHPTSSPSPTAAAPADAEPSKKRKKTASRGREDEAPLDISIMGGKYSSLAGPGGGGGKKSQAELDEDAEIAWLEYQLRKGKGKGKAGAGGDDDLEDDGLDDLLNFADTIVPFGEADDEDGDEAGDGLEEDEEDLEMDDDVSASEHDDEEEEEPLDAFYTSDSDNEGDEASATTAALTKTNTNRNASLLDAPTPNAPAFPETAVPPSTINLRESTPASAGQEAGKYVPPHVRALLAAAAPENAGKVEKTQEQVKLERRMQGLLNKSVTRPGPPRSASSSTPRGGIQLSEANIESIVNEVEALYRDHSRNSVTSTITELVINLVSDRANLLDSFVILYAALLAALYKVKGLEFGAHVIQTLVLKYKALVDQLQGTSEEEAQAGKQPLNVLTLIAELYNFQVISCRLIYDLIRGFIENLVPQGQEVTTGVEFPVEGLLKVLRDGVLMFISFGGSVASGSQLRMDDPTSLKDIVQLVQQKTAGQESKMTTRSKFMVETLVNVKNNKMRAIPGGEIAAESTQKMKRFLGGLTKKKHILAHEPIRVSLDDLLNAETKGKWWLVGAAWAGNPLVDRQKEQEAAKVKEAAVTAGKKKVVMPISNDNDEDDELDLLGMDNTEELIKLARKQGMNTDIRRSIFIIMMTSDDYVHACDRLSALKFNETQQRDFVRVALHCCGVETQYNPYYTLILQNLCESSFSHRFTFQYAMWDFLREMGETDVGGAAVINSGGHSGTMGFGTDNKVSKTRIANLAKMCGWLIAKGAVDLTIFKPVDFTNLQPKTKTFFRTTITYIFLGVRTESPLFKLPSSKTSKSGKSVSTQAIEDARDLLRATFQKSLAHTSLAQGMNFFLRGSEMKKVVNGDLLEEIGDEGRAVVKDGLKVAKEVVVVAA